MAETLTHKIIIEHLVSGDMATGSEIAISMDQTLTQDATGTMACLQFEAMGIPRVKTQLSVSYVDHNMLQVGYENADDHRYLQSFASKYGLLFSRPGNGICHQVHLERFAVPGQTLLGADSHTPTAGGMGMLAIGAGGLDIAVAMGGGPFYLSMPKVVLVRLNGSLPPWVAAKDVILGLLRRLTVRGGVGKVMEYGGEGIASLEIPERGTITNMGAELGATSSVFPSDEVTRAYLKAQDREDAWKPLSADPGAVYDEVVEINLSELVPLAAQPHMPDRVVPVAELAGTKVSQVCVGSCTNSSYRDLVRVAAILEGKMVHPDLSLTISPGSRQVYEMISESGALTTLISAGARILEAGCGPCIGMGQSPAYGGVSLRTFNRNFEGRSGTQNAQVYLASAEVAAATALTGVITDPRTLGKPPQVAQPREYLADDRMIIRPAARPEKVSIQRGPNIVPLKPQEPLQDDLKARVLLVVGDNISTDHILPGTAKVLPYRSNIPAISEFTFEGVDASFVARAREWGGGILVGGNNYGQGSSREHAALAPAYLGVKAVIAKSFARIHRDNLINNGILPLTLVNEADYATLAQGDELQIDNLHSSLRSGQTLIVRNVAKGRGIVVRHGLSPRQVDVVLAGGLLNYTKLGGKTKA
ncbi:MAG: aconitate hydratase [Chloroflexi bacterium]|nr:aconitate hydratase [Chloroflexota bacterium]